MYLTCKLYGRHASMILSQSLCIFNSFVTYWNILMYIIGYFKILMCCDEQCFYWSDCKCPCLLFSGENLKYYPKNSHLVVVDRNVYIHAYLDSNPGLTRNVSIERVIVSSEDRLEAIPDSSVDAVVATFVLCSVTRISLILSEIKRILAPVNRN